MPGGGKLILDHVTLPYSQIKSFNDLPTPFACVATDLTTSKQKVFHDGSLALAMRATMSLPGIFSPVHSGDNLYAWPRSSIPREPLASPKA